MSQHDTREVVSCVKPGDAAITPAAPSLTIAVVIVTYNRKELLQQTIQSIRAQTHRISRVVIVDNCSSDGTRELLEQLRDDTIEPLLMRRNLGGAGGFSAGIEHAFRLGSDLIWVMDDDVLPATDALEKLILSLGQLRSAGVEPNFLISNVFNAAHEPVNTPVMDLRIQKNGNQRWPVFLKEGIIPVLASSFVGTLICRGAVAQYGLPIAEMFIWGDDTEYTFRLTKDREAGYVVGSSRIVHLGRGTEVSIRQESNPVRIANFFYFYRNNTYVFRRYGSKQARAAFVLRLVRDVAYLGFHLEARKLAVVLRGVASGLMFRPIIRRVG